MNQTKKLSPDNIALSFHDLGISSVSPTKAILQNISGYVVKGGITAVLGASPSGKSVLLNVLAGRLPGLHVKGKITCEGVSIDPHDLQNEISCVPASDKDFLVPDLTPRETLLNTMLMKQGGRLDHSIEDTVKEVDDLIKQFSLMHVADTKIGYTLELGLLGGERKRVEVCSELISCHPILLLDEPTSGLDGCIAYEVLVAIKKLVLRRNKELSIILSIHQPNRRILELFDHILLLGGGGMYFFGTLQESIDYFTGIGFPPSLSYTPTDVFLQITDPHFGSHRDVNFEGLFSCSSFASELHIFLNEVERRGTFRALKSTISGTSLSNDNEYSQLSSAYVDPFSDSPRPYGKPNKAAVRPAESISNIKEVSKPNSYKSFVESYLILWRQYQTLVYRDFAIAYRDRSLYLLEMATVIGFGFFVGAVFFKLRFEIWTLVIYIHAALAWVVMIVCYAQVFKIYHLTRGNLRFKHESSNNAVSAGVVWLAELTTTSVMVLCFLPGVLIALAMMGVPAESYPFNIFLFWMTTLTAESMFYLITKFSDSPSVSVVISQAILVILTVFGGGIFIAWNKVPKYWYWLQELSIFTQASRAAIMNVDDYVNYPCKLQYGMCITFYGTMPCDASPPTDLFGTCDVKGRSVLHVLQGTIADESKWIPFAYIVLMFGIFRLTALFLMYYPWEKITAQIKGVLFGFPSSELLDCKMELRMVKSQMTAMLHMKKAVVAPTVQKPVVLATETFVHSITGDDSQSLNFSDQKQQERSIQAENSTYRIDSEKALTCSPVQINAAEAYANLAVGYKRLQFGPGTQTIIKPKTQACAGNAIVNEVSTATLVNYFNFDESLNKENDKGNRKRFYCLEWYDLSVTLKKNGRVLIDNVSGCALPGRILAIMGPSGAGKTTLLRGLTNRAPFARITGQIVFGKREFSSKDLMFVPQYDEFNQNMTVFEMIQFIGNMKCHHHQDMLNRLISLLKILGLSNKANCLCSELTSGELKRVSVGMGMIANPNVLFLDEPTRGLDSTAAYAIVDYLSELSKNTNVVIIMSIHQPAQIVFDKLQDLYLIGKEGHLAYFGPSNCATKYFEKYGFRCPDGLNAVDFYLDLIANPYPISHNPTDEENGGGAGGKVKTWEGLYSQSTLSKNIEVIMEHAVLLTTKAHEPPPIPPYWKRFMYMMSFFWSCYIRDRRLYYLRYAFLIVCGVFVGTLFLGLTPDTVLIPNYAGAVFFNIWIVLYSVVAATGIYATDRRQVMELVKNAVIAPSFYCIAQFIVSLPFNLVAAVMFQSIFHWLTSVNPHNLVFLYGIVATMGHLLLMEGIMFSVVAICKNTLLSVTSAVVVLAYLFLFSGFFVTSSMPVWIRWIADITPTFYSFSGYLWEIFASQTFAVTGVPNQSAPGEIILNIAFDRYNVKSWKMIGALYGWIFCFRFVHYFFFTLEAWPFLKAPSMETRSKKK